MQIIIINLILISLCINLYVCKKYHNYTLLRAIPEDEEHLDYLRNLSQKFYDIDFWRPPVKLYKPVDFVVCPHSKVTILRDASYMGLFLDTVIQDVQSAFDAQTVKSYVRSEIKTFNWNYYYRLHDIYQWLRDLAQTNPTEVFLYNIGTTYENRQILAAKIVLRGCKKRSKVIVEGGIHAREWISPAFVTYFLNQILTSQTSKDEDLKNIALTYEWHFVPSMNPDGYEYSHVEDRLWRKNRYDGHGVDLNRNFDMEFGTVGIDWDKYSSVYCGPHAFSEKESKAIANLVKSNADDLEYYFSFHSYGQYIIIPYGHSKQYLDNFQDVKKMCAEAEVKIASKYNTRYTTGTAYETVGYLTSGASTGWVKKTFRIPYVIMFELPDRGYDGFALSPEKILPACQETMDGLIALLRPRTLKYQKLEQFKAHSKASGIFGINVNVFCVPLFIILNELDL